MDPWVISEVLKPNLECTGFIDVSHIHMLRVEKFLTNAEKSQGRNLLRKHIWLFVLKNPYDYCGMVNEINTAVSEQMYNKILWSNIVQKLIYWYLLGKLWIILFILIFDVKTAVYVNIVLRWNSVIHGWMPKAQ